jgi:hypothetical protein
VGGPATIFAAVVLIIYLVTWLHPALAPAKAASRSVPRRSCSPAP